MRFDGADAAAPGARRARRASPTADVVVIAPSNPIVSIGPVLAVPGVRDGGRGPARPTCVAVSPIVAGAALKGPADRMLPSWATSRRWSASPGSTRRWPRTLVIDEADADLADAVEAEGMRCVVAPHDHARPDAAAAALARRCSTPRRR